MSSWPRDAAARDLYPAPQHRNGEILKRREATGAGAGIVVEQRDGQTDTQVVLGR